MFFTNKNAMHWRFFIFFHGVTIHLITMSKKFHSLNQNALVVLS